jgi:osmoprotectant transport system ATP-binding protein
LTDFPASGAPIVFRNVSFELKGRPILANVSVEVGRGETLAILGRSGVGKTTMLRLVNGLAFPTAGEVLVDGKATVAWDPVRLKRGIGYVIQDGGLFPHYTVAQNIGLVPRLEGWSAERIKTRTAELLDAVGLSDPSLAGRYPRELSGGQRQRVGVARALAAGARILLLDEPFGALDPLTRSNLQKEFLRWAADRTALLVTHDVHEAIRLAAKIALFDEGRLIFFGTRDQFLETTDARVRPLAEIVLGTEDPSA